MIFRGALTGPQNTFFFFLMKINTTNEETHKKKTLQKKNNTDYNQNKNRFLSSPTKMKMEGKETAPEKCLAIKCPITN